MEKMLVALDYTGCAFEVAEVASELAAKLGSEVVLLSVVNAPSENVVLHGAFEGMTAAQVLDSDAERALIALKTVFTDRGLQPHVMVGHGPPADAILAAAAQQDVTLIVTGTHGRTGLRRIVQGSVAEQVLRRATVPVLTLRTLAPHAHPGLTAAQRAVLAEADG